MASGQGDLSELEDELIAHQEIQAFYQRKVDEAAQAAAKATERHLEAMAQMRAALRALSSEGRLPERDVPWIAMLAGDRPGTTDAILHDAPLFDPNRPATDEESARARSLRQSHETATARNAATARWLEANGYDTGFQRR